MTDWMVVILPGWNTGSIDVYIPLRSADEPNLLPPVWWKSSASTTPMWRLNASEWTLLMALWQSPQQIRARLPQRGSPIIYVTEPTLSDHGRHRMFGFVLCKALTDATCWNAIFLLFQHRRKQRKTILILEISFICFCSIASTHRALVPWEFGCLYREC